MIFPEEPDPFDFSTSLQSFDHDSVHNISPIRDMNYFREEWKHSAVGVCITLQLYQSVINRYLVPRYFHYIPIRGDGNCAYRASSVRYMQLLICINDPQMLSNLRENIEAENGIYKSEWSWDFQDKYKPTVQRYLRQIEQALREEGGVKEALTLFHEMVLLNEKFDKGLILLLRIMVANFIKEYGSNCFNGLPLEFIFDQKHSSLEEYVKKEVMVMGEEAQDLAVMLIPVVLRIGVTNVMISNEANDGIKIEEYPARTDQTKLFYTDGLNFHDHNWGITLFFRPGHYEILLENEFIKQFPQILQSFQFMHTLGYSDSGALIKHLSFVERMSEENKSEQPISMESSQEVKTVKLHCSHEFKRHELIENLKKSFHFEPQNPEIQDFFVSNIQSPKAPQCLTCHENFSFNDFQQIWPEQKFTRRNYVTVKSDYQKRLEEDIKKLEDKKEKLKNSLNSQENPEGAKKEEILPDQYKAQFKAQENKPLEQLNGEEDQILQNQPQQRENQSQEKIRPEMFVVNKKASGEGKGEEKDQNQNIVVEAQIKGQDAVILQGQQNKQEEQKQEARAHRPRKLTLLMKIMVGASIGIGGVLFMFGYMMVKKLFMRAIGKLALLINWK